MTKRKDGLWQQSLTVMEHGRKKQKYFYGKTKQEVLKKISEYRESFEKGPLFETVADEWWEQHEPTLGPSTNRAYIPSIKRANNYFKGRYIREIKPADIVRFLQVEIAQKNYSQKVAKSALMVLHLIYKYAIANGYVDYNVSRDVEIPRNLSKKTRDMPLMSDIKKIKQSTSEQMGMFAYWALYTGCRRSELLALTWDDVDLKNRTITISKAKYDKNGKCYIKQPKSEAGKRIVPLVNRLYEKIIPGHGVIFSKNGAMMTDRQFQRDWEKYAKETGIQCTPHQLRHSYATMLYEQGVAVKDAQVLLGHAQAATTQDIYTHIRSVQREKVRSKLLNIDLSM